MLESDGQGCSGCSGRWGVLLMLGLCLGTVFLLYFMVDQLGDALQGKTNPAASSELPNAPTVAPSPPPELLAVVSAGPAFGGACALDSEGTVWAFGEDGTGKLLITAVDADPRLVGGRDSCLLVDRSRVSVLIPERTIDLDWPDAPSDLGDMVWVSDRISEAEEPAQYGELIAAEQGELDYWLVEPSGPRRLEVGDGPSGVTALAVSPSDKTLLVAQDGQVISTPVEYGGPVHVLDTPVDVRALAWLGDRIVVATEDSVLMLGTPGETAVPASGDALVAGDYAGQKGAFLHSASTDVWGWLRYDDDRLVRTDTLLTEGMTPVRLPDGTIGVVSQPEPGGRPILGPGPGHPTQ